MRKILSMFVVMFGFIGGVLHAQYTLCQLDCYGCYLQYNAGVLHWGTGFYCDGGNVSCTYSYRLNVYEKYKPLELVAWATGGNTVPCHRFTEVVGDLYPNKLIVGRSYIAYLYILDGNSGNPVCSAPTGFICR